MLPEIKNYIYQPNRVTNSIYTYSLIQEKLLNAVIFYLQDAVKLSLKGQDYEQLTLWKDFSKESRIIIHIPLREISIPQHYDYVKNALKKLASMIVEIPYIEQETGKPWQKIRGLLSADIPDKSEYSSHIKILIDKDVAELLIKIDQNNLQQPINYTRFIYEIAQGASNKYTPRIYKLLCSWKKKGGFVISLDEFRRWLGIEEKYKEFDNLKKWILLPAQNELYEKADCWFNCKESDFTIRDGKKITHLNFKIITPELIEEEEKRKDYILNLLRTHFSFTDKHIDQIRPIFDKANTTEIIRKISELKNYHLDNINKIGDITGYAIKSLLNQFNSEKLF